MNAQIAGGVVQTMARAIEVQVDTDAGAPAVGGAAVGMNAAFARLPAARDERCLDRCARRGLRGPLRARQAVVVERIPDAHPARAATNAAAAVFDVVDSRAAVSGPGA